MTPEVLRGMRHELVKRAGLASTLARYARPFVMRAGLPGAAAGAALGAGAGVAREAVAGEGDYGGAALRGAAGGALLGGVGGFGVGKVRDIALTTGKRGLGLAGEAGRRTVKSVGDWGKRQVHGTTGWTPKAGPKSIGLAGRAQTQRIEVAKAMQKARLKGVTDPAKRKKLTEVAEKRLSDLKRQGEAAQEAYQAGLTSLPGTVKGLVKDPKRFGKAALKSIKEHPGGLAGAAVLPGAFIASDVASGVPLEEAIGGGAGDVAGLALTGAMPIVPGMAAWTALSEGGRAIGRAVKGKRKKTPMVSPPAPSAAPVQPIRNEVTQ